MSAITNAALDETVATLTMPRADLFALALAAEYAARGQRESARVDFTADESPAMHANCLAAADRLEALARDLRAAIA